MLPQFREMANLPAAFRSLPVVVDGELCVLDANGKPDFQALQQREKPLPGHKRRKPSPVTFVAFDLLYADGRDLREKPLEERKRAARAHHRARARRDVLEARRWARARSSSRSPSSAGSKGIIGKVRTSPYRSIRSREWVKIKAKQRQEFVIGGWTEPRGCAHGVRRAAGRLLRGRRSSSTPATSAPASTTSCCATDAAPRHRSSARPRRSRCGPRRTRRPTGCSPSSSARSRSRSGRRKACCASPSSSRCAATRTRRASSCASATQPAGRPTREIAPRPRSTVGGRARRRCRTTTRCCFRATATPRAICVAYYRAVAPVLLPYLRDNPLTMERFPDGIARGARDLGEARCRAARRSGCTASRSRPRPASRAT